jgi:hypothetical protein
VDHDNEKFFAVLAAGQEVASEFNAQNAANTTWAFAMVTCCDEQLFSVASEFNVRGCANMAWAFAQCTVTLIRYLLSWPLAKLHFYSARLAL